jgi:hypothetical protein
MGYIFMLIWSSNCCSADNPGLPCRRGSGWAVRQPVFACANAQRQGEIGDAVGCQQPPPSVPRMDLQARLWLHRGDEDPVVIDLPDEAGMMDLMTLADLDAAGAFLRDFATRHGIRRLALFGSVLRGDETSGGDIDLLVEFEEAGHPAC